MISLILPCLNEESSVAGCVEEASHVLSQQSDSYEVIVVNNGSDDNSAEVAKRAGARVVFEPKRGYGSALLKGFEVAKGNILIMADSDRSYNLNQIPIFLEKLEATKADMVIGNRFAEMKKGAMPLLHRTIGNPVLSFIFRSLFPNQIQDLMCGFRVLTKKSFSRLELTMPGMEFAVEMLLQAVLMNLRVEQIDIEYHPRIGESKLKTFSDGWKHLLLILKYTQTHRRFQFEKVPVLK